MEFQKFYTSTAEGLKTPPLDNYFVTSEFNKIDKMKSGRISKEAFKFYLSLLYAKFIEIINSELSSLNRPIYSQYNPISNSSLQIK